jgi:ligand-binding sensor domain-containing protein
MQRTWIISFFLISNLCCLSAQPFPKLKFTHLSTRDGLSSEIINDILQDHRGIIWISTYDGLNRYDGTSITVYRHIEGDSTSIPNNDTRDLAIDQQNRLWIATEKGLCCFNTVTGKAVNYYVTSSPTQSLLTNIENQPFVDSRNRLWLASPFGIQWFDVEHKSFITYKMPPRPPSERSEHENYFRSIREDTQHQLWATSFFGLFRIDEKNQKLIPYDQGQVISNISWHQTKAGEYLVGQWGGGVKRFDPATGTYTPIFLETKDQNLVTDFIEWKDAQQKDWLCISLDGGLLLVDPVSQQKELYVHNEMDPSSLQGAYLSMLFLDRDNRIWLGTDHGIDILDPQLQYFDNHYLYQQVDRNNPKTFGTPRSLFETKEEYIIATWFMKGLFYFDHEWQLLRHQPTIPPHSVSHASAGIYSMLKDAKGNFWFATDSGLVRENKGVYTFMIPPGAYSMLYGDLAFREIWQRPDGLFWLRTKTRGIYLFNPVDEKFLAHYEQSQNDFAGRVLSGALDESGDLWIGTDSAFYQFEEASHTFKAIPYTKNGQAANFTNINSILYDHHEYIWLATEHGLGRYTIKTKEATLLDKKDGLPDEHLLQLLEDTTGILWLKSEQGIARYDATKGFQFFTFQHGLPDFYNAFGVFTLNSDSHILSGQNGAISEFNPYSIPWNSKNPDLILCDVRIDQQSIDFEKNPGVITMRPGQRTFQLHFSIPSYTASSLNQFFYRIPGLMEEWVAAPGGRVTFHELPVGEYSLQLKGKDFMNRESEVMSLSVLIRPYWYQTGWFRILAALFIISSILFFIRWRIRAVRKEAAYKQKIAESEMQILRTQMNPHFIFNSLNSIENFIMENEKRLASDYLNKFAHLIRLILDSSRNELIPFSKDMEALQLYVDLEQLRFNHKFEYQVKVDPELLGSHYSVPALIIQPYIENAIIHGLANSENPNLVLSVKAEAVEEGIRYSIEDNGIGRMLSKTYHELNHRHTSSVGMKITEDRINRFNHQAESNGSIRITDLYDDYQHAVGTKVEIILKMK